MKPYKATGKFFDDVETLSRMFNIKVHPALKPPVKEDFHKESGS
jgi:hypothetical protein